MTVEQALKESRGTTLMEGRAIREVQAMLYAGECVQWAITGNMEVIDTGAKMYGSMQNYFDFKNKVSGVMVLTDQRVIFCSSILFGSNKMLKTFALDEVCGVNQTSTLALATLRVQGIFETLSIQGGEFGVSGMRTRLEQAVKETKAKTAQPAPAPQDTQTLEGQLRSLKSLLDDGILTTAEYEAKKKQILGL